MFRLFAGPGQAVLRQLARWQHVQGEPSNRLFDARLLGAIIRHPDDRQELSVRYSSSAAPGALPVSQSSRHGVGAPARHSDDCEKRPPGALMPIRRLLYYLSPSAPAARSVPRSAHGAPATRRRGRRSHGGERAPNGVTSLIVPSIDIPPSYSSRLGRARPP